MRSKKTKKLAILRLFTAALATMLLAAASALATPQASAMTVEETQGIGNTYQLVIESDPGGPQSQHASTCSGSFNDVFAAGNRNDDEADIPLPFLFEFYGTTYAQVRVGVNGGLSFDLTEDIWATNGDLGTSPGADHPAIYPFWDNLEFEAAGLANNVFWCTEGVSPNRVFEIIWWQVDCSSVCNPVAGQTVSFKAKLFEVDDAIEFHYENTEFGNGIGHNRGALATVGIDSGDSSGGDTAYLQYSINAPEVFELFSIRFTPVTCVGMTPTQTATRSGGVLTGTANDDVLVGHFGDDILRGNGGDDRLCGNAGDDTIRGGPGNDQIRGGDGADTLLGGGGADNLRGDDGADVLMGQGGVDQLRGGAGPDDLSGQGAADQVFGDDGDDIVRGQNGADFLSGAQGNDQVIGNTGPDELEGGTEDDNLIGGNGNDVLWGDTGFDKCAGNLGPADEAHAASCELTPGVEILF